MFKRMKLSTKIGAGFVVLVVLLAAVGVTTRVILSKVTQKVTVTTDAKRTIELVLNARRQEKNFVLRGFTKYGSDTKNSFELWQDIMTQLDQGLAAVKSSPSLSEAERASAAQAQQDMAGYRAAFESQGDARKAKDAALAAWREVGGEITAYLQTIRSKTIDPSTEQARQDGKTEELFRWNAIARGLEDDVIQNFLTLRVTAVYVIATNADAQWEAYQTQLAKTQKGIADWRQSVTGVPALEQAAEQLSLFATRYSAAGENYHKGIVMQQQLDETMDATARAALKNIESICPSHPPSMLAWGDPACDHAADPSDYRNLDRGSRAGLLGFPRDLLGFSIPG